MADESTGFFGKHVSMINRFELIYYDKALQAYHIGGGQQFFLMVIGCNPGISQWELSKKIAMDKGTTAKAVKKLEEEGYITRTALSNDKRVKQLAITKKAEPLLKEMERLRSEWLAILMDGMQEQEIMQLEMQMHQIAQRAWDYTKQRYLGEKE